MQPERTGERLRVELGVKNEWVTSVGVGNDWGGGIGWGRKNKEVT